MSSGALTRRLVVWVVFVAFCTLGMGFTQLPWTKLPALGTITYFEVVLLLTGLLGIGPLFRFAGASQRSGSRAMCRILIAYLAFELLVVLPVAVWLGMAKPTAIMSEMAVRFTWLLFPMVLVMCADDRTRSRAGTLAIIAASCLAAWGLYSAATGGAGYYLESGELRYRVLYGGALVLFAWPFVVALSRDISRRTTVPLLAVSLVGLVLTNMRSGYVAFAIAGLACLVMSGQIRRVVPWIVPAALMVIVVWLLWGRQAGDALGYTMSHLLDFSSGNGADRVMRDVLAWDFFVRYPFNDYVWSWRYFLVYVHDGYGPHNFLLNVAVTEGVAGLAFYGSVLMVTLRGAWTWGKRDAVARALGAYLIFYLVFALGNATWYIPVDAPLFIAAAAGLVARVDQLRAAEADDAAEQAERDRDGGSQRPNALPADGDAA